MNPEDVAAPACWLIAAMAAVALLLLRNPDSSLSCYVDRTTAGTAEGNLR